MVHFILVIFITHPDQENGPKLTRHENKGLSVFLTRGDNGFILFLPLENSVTYVPFPNICCTYGRITHLQGF